MFFLKASDSGVMRCGINSSVLINKAPHHVGCGEETGTREISRTEKKKNPVDEYEDPQIRYSLGSITEFI